MRRLALLPLLAVLAACAPSPTPLEPGLDGYLHILASARDARQACAGLDCGRVSVEEALARAKARAPDALFMPAGRAAPDRALAEAAFQAAYADCRSRGIGPGSPRWDSCRMDRGIARLSEVAALR